jgi:hypothetical protein
MKSTQQIRLTLLSLLLLSFMSSAAGGQGAIEIAAARSSATEGSPSAGATAADRARAAFAAHGGEKFRALKTITLKGVGTAVSPLSPDAVPAEITMISTEDRIRIDLAVPFGIIQLINDGKQFYNLVNGAEGSFGLAPPAKFGLRVLARYGQKGYTAVTLPDPDVERSFRITDPEGNATDFYLGPASSRVTRIAYKYNDLRQSWELGSFKEVEGVMVPHSVTIRLESKVGDYLISLQAVDVKLNQPVDNAAFIPQAK